MTEQAQKLTLTSRAFYNSMLGPYEKYVTEYFGYDKVLPMNTGAEAVETAIKIARKWAYDVKGVPAGKAKILTCENNFHGRTTTIVGFSTDPDSTGGFGPFTPGFEVIPYDNIDALKEALKDPNVAGFLVEPIQGEAGVYVPVRRLHPRGTRLVQGRKRAVYGRRSPDRHRPHRRLAGHLRNVQLRRPLRAPSRIHQGRPAHPRQGHLRGRVPGERGSRRRRRHGRHPSRSARLHLWRQPGRRRCGHGRPRGGQRRAPGPARPRLGQPFPGSHGKPDRRKRPHQLRARAGLLNAILINDTPDSSTAWDLCVAMKDNGLIAKPTHGNIIRFAPPLVMTEEQLDECVAIIRKTVLGFTRSNA